MLTKEQIKNLKKGDKVLAEVSFISVNKDNDLTCKAPFTNSAGDIIYSGIFFHPSCLSLPPAKQKYDPCRKLKKGDIVKKRWVDGRTDADLPFDEASEVCSDEDMYGNIRVQTPSKYTAIVKAVFVELVTPVEENKPYRAEKCLSRYIVYYHDSDEDGMTGRVYEHSAFYFGHPKQYTEDEALAAAEAECERLNAKHGK